MKIFLCIFLLFSTTTFGASFNCENAKTLVEQYICKDSNISRQDEELNDIYKTILDKSYNPEQEKIEQKAWLKERNACKDAECIESSYSTRIVEIKNEIKILNLKSEVIPDGIVGTYTHKDKSCFFVIDDKNKSDDPRMECNGFYTDVLSIKKSSSLRAKIKIDLNFFNGHTCSYSGKGIWRGDSIFTVSDMDEEDGAPCNLTIKFLKNKAIIESNHEYCSTYCGARGSLDGASLTKK